MKRQTPLWAIHAGGAISLLIITCIVWFLAIAPAFHSREAYAQLVDQFKREGDAIHDAEARELAAAGRLNALRDSLDQHPLLLSSQDDLSKKLQQISDVATHAGMQLSSIEAGKSSNYQHHSTIAIQLAARCSLPTLWNFFHNLRLQMPDISVRSIDLAGRYNDKTTIPSLTMELLWHTAPSPEVALR